jgi:hypothetical protein
MKTVCEMNKDQRKTFKADLGKNPTFTCKKCGAKAMEKKRLCKPQKSS